MNPLSRCILHALAIVRGSSPRFHLAGIRREAGVALALIGALLVAPIVAAAVIVSLSH